MGNDESLFNSRQLCSAYNNVVNEVGHVYTDERVQMGLRAAIASLSDLWKVTQVVHSEREIQKLTIQIEAHRKNVQLFHSGTDDAEQ